VTALRLDDVRKEYAEGARVRTVLEHACLSVEPGELVAIQGRSGSGKTTLLNLAAGLDSPTQGEVWVGAQEITRLGPRERTLVRRRRMGFVFQFFNLIPTLTVLENVALQAELAGTGTPAARRSATDLLEVVGLADRGDTFPDRLSGGEQQRVAVARALVHGPELVLADEPTGNLDDATGAAVMDLLERLTRDAGRSMLVVTHSDGVARRADRVLAIERGRLVPAP
jgi:putative ABC transport system ATP-binding protein